MKWFNRRNVIALVSTTGVALLLFAALFPLFSRAREKGRLTLSELTPPVTPGALPSPMPAQRAMYDEAAETKTLGEGAGVAHAAPAPTKVSRKVIMTANVTIEVKDFEKVHADVVKVASKLSGYVANSVLELPREGPRSGSVTIRVPQEKYDHALALIKNLGKVIRENQTAEDVTQKYIDLDARVRNLKAGEQKLLEIMARARTIKETLQVHERLTELREKIEVIEGQFRYLKFQIEMATITVTLTEKATALIIPEPKWVWLNEVKRSWHALVVVTQWLVTAVTRVAIVLGPFALGIGLILWMVRKARRQKA